MVDAHPAGHQHPHLFPDATGANGFIGLPLTIETAQTVAQPAAHHRDPFDRLLIAQALAGPMHLYTADAALAVYTDLVHIVP